MIAKPFDIEELLTMIRAGTSSREADDETSHRRESVRCMWSTGTDNRGEG